MAQRNAKNAGDRSMEHRMEGLCHIRNAVRELTFAIAEVREGDGWAEEASREIEALRQQLSAVPA